MDVLHETPILKFNSDTLNSMRALYGLEAPERVDDAVNILVEWLKKQDHLIKKDFSRDYLERAIILSKGSVERAKRKIDKICTFRTILPYFFEEINVREIPASKVVICGVLPKMTEDHCRVFMLKSTIKKYNSGFSNLYKYIAMMCEYLQAHDYSKSLICVYDFLNADIMELLKNIDMGELREGIAILTRGYGARMKGIHILAASNAVDILLTILKQIAAKKMIDRIHVHKSIDTLSDHISKEALPEEYGGYGDTLKNVCENVMNELSTEEFTEYFREKCQARTDETLRNQELFNEQYMGMPGSFRKLCVD